VDAVAATDPVTRTWHALEVQAPPAARELVEAELWEFEPLGLEEDPEDPGRVVAYRAEPWDRAVVEAALSALPAHAGDWRVATFEVADEDWSRVWKRTWRPTPLGARLLAVPAWLEPDDPARVTVRIEPGRAFGTGTHETTALAWRLLEERLAEGAPRLLVEVGTGTGVLALGALLLAPALRAVGTEIDPQAVPSLRDNLVLNPEPAARFLAVHAARLPLRDGAADLVLANLTAHEHERVDAEVSRVAAGGATVILSGLLDDQTAPLRERWLARGARERGHARDGEWNALRLELP
jgi:ribosomal protein L11 methyltransferase